MASTVSPDPEYLYSLVLLATEDQDLAEEVRNKLIFEQSHNASSN